MSSIGCSHVLHYKKSSKNRESFKWIYAVFVIGTGSKFRKTRIGNAYCKVCKKRGPFLHACLGCVFFGCHKHIRDHSEREKHYLSIDTIYGHIHCNYCGDYMYDVEIDKMARDSRIYIGGFRRRLFETTSWDPNKEQKELLRLKTRKVCCTPHSTIGLRGLINSGNTCFVNCILQALIHTPVLRDYFLAGAHKCDVKRGRCFVCEISKLFQEFYGGLTDPLALGNFLLLIWSIMDDISVNKQQDAQEFFIKIRDMLHNHCPESLGPLQTMSNNKLKKCPCIVDQIFTGATQSDVVCQTCKGISTTLEPVADFSLDIDLMTCGDIVPSLLDCLRNFTRPERLESKIMCSYCQSYQECTRQLTIKTLPLVICFHLKRFKKKKEQQMAKISTVISFPEMLDMTPFMTRPKRQWLFSLDNRYSLFAVVNHVGKFSGGHYFAYVRQQRDFWYKCDDHIITRADLQEVLDSEGYLLFYHKHVLNYQ